MNKNNKSMRLMAAAMVTVITAGMAGTCNYQRNVITAKAADVKELQKVAETALETDSVEAEETEETEEASEEEKEQGAKKEESVYVKADPAGNVKDTTVTEWIKNPGNGKLSDVSELDGIENIKERNPIRFLQMQGLTGRQRVMTFTIREPRKRSFR